MQLTLCLCINRPNMQNFPKLMLRPRTLTYCTSSFWMRYIYFFFSQLPNKNGSYNKSNCWYSKTNFQVLGRLNSDDSMARHCDCTLIFLLRWLPKRRDWRLKLKEAKNFHDVICQVIKLESATNEMRRTRLVVPFERLLVGSTLYYDAHEHRQLLAKREPPSWWSRLPMDQQPLAAGVYKVWLTMIVAVDGPVMMRFVSS